MATKPKLNARQTLKQKERSISHNTYANYIGTVWSAIMGLAFIPLYIHYLGTEAYGMIGILGFLQAAVVLLDFGLGPTMTRVMAQFSAKHYSNEQVHELFHSIEIVYLLIAVLSLSTITLSSEWLAEKWLNEHQLQTDTIQLIIFIAGFVISLRFLGGLYKSAVNGLQAQILFNIIHIIFSTLRGPGVLIILVWVSSSLKAFFIHQAIVAAIEVIVLRITVFRLLPKIATSSTFSLSSLSSIWHFAAGTTISLLLLFSISNIDKILLPTSIPLKEFGYYTIAVTAANALFLLAMPINEALQPRLTELVTQNDKEACKQTYHHYSRLLAIITTPIALSIALFPQHALFLWGLEQSSAEQVSSLLSLLMIGTLFYNFNHLSRIFSLAHGNVRLLVIIYIIAAIIFFPGIRLAIEHSGSQGAAWAWLLFNVLYFVISPYLIHHQQKVTIGINWYTQNILPPLLLCSVVGIMLSSTLPQIPVSVSQSITVMLLVSSLLCLPALVSTPGSRQWLI